ncbi:MAG TPA: arginine--tRNA ligase, partial [Candidatus Paceibacterota bacterium]|nr:arginine--tRNA ligase [Candidatus Paceibacterota bacterium]
FINFYLSREFFADSVKEILKADEKFGSNKIGKGKKVLVEYSSPNIAKPFTIGHLRSTIIGDSVANLLEFSGYKVIRDNHLGDWGTQFGKQIVAIKKWGSVAELDEAANKMKYLVDLYVRFHAEAETDLSLEEDAREAFVSLEKGDKESVTLYKKIVAISEAYFESIYKRLNIQKFDTEQGEHFYESYVPKVVKVLEDKHLLKKSEGAELVFFDVEKYPPLMIKKSDGATLYATRDLATDMWRLKKYGKDIVVINETGNEQSLYFKQLFEIEKMLGWFTDAQRIHISHGLYRSKEGNMSTRKGNAVWLEEVLDEAVSRAKVINPESADVVGIGAIKLNDLKRQSNQDIIFDWEEVLNLKGDSGPYLQYAVVRAKSVIEKAKKEGIKVSVKNPNENIAGFERKLTRFPHIVARAADTRAPHILVSYLIDLASDFNTYYAQTKIIDASDPYSPYRVALASALATVIENGLFILGINVPEKM